MHIENPGAGASHPLERFAAVLAALVCLAVTLAIWRNVSAHQGMWPLPGLYFLELPIVTLVVALAFVLDAPSRSILAWAAVGIVAAFSVLGAFSVGIAFVPVALLLAIAAISSDLRNARPIAVHVGVCLVAAMAHAALMLLAIRLLYP